MKDRSPYAKRQLLFNVYGSKDFGRLVSEAASHRLMAKSELVRRAVCAFIGVEYPEVDS